MAQRKSKTKPAPIGPDWPKIREMVVDGQRMALVPYSLWERIREQLEELLDLQCYDDACEASAEDLIEHDELCCLLGRCPLPYYRQRAGLSPKALAKKTGLSPEFIAQVEKGERCLTKASAKKIAAVLDVPLEKLMLKPTGA